MIAASAHGALLSVGAMAVTSIGIVAEEVAVLIATVVPPAASRMSF